MFCCKKNKKIKNKKIKNKKITQIKNIKKCCKCCKNEIIEKYKSSNVCDDIYCSMQFVSKIKK